MRKHKSALLLALLFGLSWAMTLAVNRSVANWVYIAKIEGPSHWLGSDILAASWALLAIVALVLWLQRDRARRALATTGAVAALILCLFNFQTAVWFRVLLYSLALTSPAVQTRYSGGVWEDLVFTGVAFMLSALSLWLCVRSAGPQQPRPLTMWRSWKFRVPNRSQAVARDSFTSPISNI